MFAALGVDATRLYSSAKTKKFSDFLPKIGVQLQLATCFRPGETDLTLEAFEGWVYQYIRRRRIGKRYFWRCRNVQNFLYFWYNVECWTGNFIIEKTMGFTRPMREKTRVNGRRTKPYSSPDVFCGGCCRCVFFPSILQVQWSSRNEIGIPVCRV